MRDESLASAPARMRHRVLLIDGTTWCVHERWAPGGAAGGAPTLVFDSAQVVRRIRRYPSDWHLLDDTTLFALSHGR